MSNYLRDVLGADNSSSEFAQPQGLVADVGPDIPGGEGANKGAWRDQLRDRLGQFAKMFGLVLFDIDIEGIGRVTGHGELVDIVRPGVGLVRVKNHKILGDIDIEMLGEQLEAIDAIIPDADYERITGKTLPKSKSSELKDSLTGAEAQARKMSTVYKNLKDEGRFPVPRQTNLNYWGVDSDVAKGAKEDYSLVYDKLKSEDASWSEKYPTFDEFWERVRQFSVGQTSQSPNELSEIPQEMKDINKAYAENVLGLKPDGKITFYRNAVNRKGSAEDSALGYVTTNADFAYDYNSQAPNESGNGRYEIDAKPDEVFGMLGYSQLEDEFGVTVGRGVTSQPGRVRRVGDLEQPKLAPWLEKYQDGVGRSTGGTPYRHYALAGQFDLLPVDPLGEDVNEFLGKYGKTTADIKAKFDELHGEGAYEDYKASGETLGFGEIKRMFVDVGNGKVGLDITRIGGMDGTLAPGGYGNGDPESFKNDKTDNTLKMLSVFQELSGQPFMVHRDHSKDDQRLDEVKVAVIEQSSSETPIAVEFDISQNKGGEYEITASDPEYGVVGRLILNPATKQNDDSETREVKWIDVDSRFQRKGIATSLWNQAVDAGLNPQHSSNRTDAGDEWAKSLGRDLPKKVTADDRALEQEEMKSEPSNEAIDFSNFEKTSDRLGSNPGGVYKDPATNKEYYVKIQDKKRGDNEQLASALYREAGLDALEVKSGTLNGDHVTYTDWRDEKLVSVSGKISGSDPLSPDDPAFDGFAIDAWLANWDVVGTGYDNLSFDRDGNPVRLDSGGSLLYRARGDRKGEAFGEEVGELETFKNPSNTTGQLFQDMGTAAEARSVKKLEAITPERIDELVDQFVSDPNDNKELKNKLKARREFILSKYDQEESSSKTDEVDTPLTPQVFTDEQEAVIKNYSSYGYRDINTYLRLGRQEAIKEFYTDNAGDRADRAEKSIEEINKVFETSTLERDATLFRLVPRDIAEGVKVGDILSDPAILSTTKNPESEDINRQFNATIFGGLERYYADKYDGAHPNDVGWTVIEIEAPAGTRAMDVTSISEFPAEREVLLPSNASLEVVSVEEIEVKNRYKRPGDIFKAYKVKVRVVPEATTPESEKLPTESKDVDVESLDSSEVATSLAPKSDSKMTSEDGRRTVEPKEVVAFETYDGKQLVNLTYTGTRLSEIFSDEGFPYPDSVYLFELKDSPDPDIKNGIYAIYSDDLDRNSSSSGLPTFNLNRNHFIGAKMPILRSVSEQKSLDKYTSSGYIEINNDLLENDGKPSDISEQVVKDLDSLLDRSVLDEDTILWRGISLKNSPYKDYLESLVPGDIISQPNYMSTSRSRAAAGTFLQDRLGNPGDLSVLMKINAKKGTKASNVFRSSLGATSREEEVLLPRGDKMFDSLVVTKVERDKFALNLLHIEFDYVPAGDGPELLNNWDPVTGLETSAEKKERIEPGFENWNKEVEKIFDDWDNDLIAGVESVDDGNILQANFIKKAGFNEKPKVLSQEEFDAIEAETIYRGHQSTSFMNSYIDSELQYAGEGYFGNGTYTSNKRDTAENYAGSSGPDASTKSEIDERILEMKLLPGANVLSFEEVPELREWADEKTREFLNGYEKSGANPAQMQDAEWRLFNEADYTNIAIMLGIDAIRFKVPLTDKEEYYTIILNRGKVAINGKS
jgi:hypothetical protein